MSTELNRNLIGKKATLVGFWVNLLLTAIKVGAGVIGKSSAMLADGIHSLSDLLSDVVVMFGFKFTEKPEDECHNYGHDKYETLATTIISIFLAIVGFEILKSGINNILFVIRGGVLPKPGVIALVAALISIATKEILYRYTVTVGKSINSGALVASAWHHRSDAFSSIGALIGIGGALILGDKWTVLDPIASVVVSIFIFKIALQILLPAINELMEKSLSVKETSLIRQVIERYPDVKDYHKLRTRRIGTKVAIEMHILVDQNLNIKSAHNISTDIETELKQEFGDTSIITIHIEPLE